MKKKIIIIISAITILCLLAIEITSMLLLKYNSKFQISHPYFNREITGFYIYKNSSGYRYNTIKTSPKEKDIVVDENGFITKDKVVKIKPENTIRIFIVGGSAAFGNGQAKPYDKIVEYSTGLFSYESSIAGNILKILESKYPEKKFEVINACASGRKINQSIAQYLAVIKDFAPDIIISMDGMNDLSTISGNSPYDEDEKYLLDSYIQISNLNRELQEKSFLSTFELVKIIKFNIAKKSFNSNSSKSADDLLKYSVNEVTEILYKDNKNNFIAGCSEFTDLICYFNAICKVDNVDFIFCIQPLLYRNTNKKLTKLEEEMRNKVNPINISLSNIKVSDKEIKEMETKGDVILRFFFDDYLSSTIDSIAIQNDFDFIDLNKKIENKYFDIEFYVDYCHLTAKANEIVAENICSKISEILIKKSLIKTE